MDLDKLIATGLSRQQAQAYALLIEHGQTSPPQAAKSLNISRTNAYKLLDKLVELKLATKVEKGKKLAYLAANPTALASYTADFRAEATAREEAANSLMQSLLSRYYEHSTKPTIQQASGAKEVAKLYHRQINLREDIHFIHTEADLPMMGFDTMHNIRVTPAQHGKKRQAIMTAPDQGPINYAAHKRSNLEVTWAEREQYNAPVEWSVTKSSLLMVAYGTEPQAILLVDPTIAGAFLQLWQLLNTLLQKEPAHKKLAQRKK